MVAKIYTPIWEKLKLELVLIIEITTSNEKNVQTRLIKTLRKALQKEKFNDTNFRSLYPYAKLSSKVLPCNQQVEFTLEKGMSSATNQSVQTIFGDTNE